MIDRNHRNFAGYIQRVREEPGMAGAVLDCLMEHGSELGWNITLEDVLELYALPPPTPSMSEEEFHKLFVQMHLDMELHGQASAPQGYAAVPILLDDSLRPLLVEWLKLTEPNRTWDERPWPHRSTPDPMERWKVVLIAKGNTPFDAKRFVLSLFDDLFVKVTRHARVVIEDAGVARGPFRRLICDGDVVDVPLGHHPRNCIEQLPDGTFRVTYVGKPEDWVRSATPRYGPSPLGNVRRAFQYEQLINQMRGSFFEFQSYIRDKLGHEPLLADDPEKE